MDVAQVFCYVFALKTDKVDTNGEPEIAKAYIYATSEASARRKYKRLYGVEADKLLTRDNW